MAESAVSLWVSLFADGQSWLYAVLLVAAWSWRLGRGSARNIWEHRRRTARDDQRVRSFWIPQRGSDCEKSSCCTIQSAKNARYASRNQCQPSKSTTFYRGTHIPNWPWCSATFNHYVNGVTQEKQLAKCTLVDSAAGSSYTSRITPTGFLSRISLACVFRQSRLRRSSSHVQDVLFHARSVLRCPQSTTLIR